MPALLSIDVYSDVVCPWCYIGSAHLDAALATLAAEDDVAAAVTYRPFLLDPTTPPEGVELVARLRAKYGVDPRPMFARVEQAGRAAGLSLDFTRVGRTWPTVGAHTLLRHAAARGTQRALARALFSAYFDEGRNIGDADLLAELAARHGFTADEARALAADERERELTRCEAAAASARGIRGVPFFVFDQRLALSGAQPAEVLVAAAREALRRSPTTSPKGAQS
jgi:predicted DsbA family dithiol-disulfide isomerase